MTAIHELRYAEPKEIAKEARQVLKAAFPGVKFSLRSVDNTVAIVYNDADAAEEKVREAVWHLRAYDNDPWGALAKNPIRLSCGETVRGLHDLTVRNDYRPVAR